MRHPVSLHLFNPRQELVGNNVAAPKCLLVGVLRPRRLHEDRVAGAGEVRALGRDARRHDEDTGLVTLLELLLVDGPDAEWSVGALAVHL